MVDIALAAQFDGHRQTAHGDRVAFAEALLQLPPHQGGTFIKRLPAGIGGQQVGLRTQVARQRFYLRPGFGCGVQVGHGFEVAMQVQHHVGITGQALQHQALGVQLGLGGVPGQGAGQCTADQLGITLRIIAQQFFHLVADVFAEVDEQAIEVLPAFQFVAAQGDVHQHLFQAHRVGDRHQHDFAAQAPDRFKLCQARLEVPGHQHARQFIGMQGGLDVHLAFGLLRAEVKTVDLPRRARHRRDQVM